MWHGFTKQNAGKGRKSDTKSENVWLRISVVFKFAVFPVFNISFIACSLFFISREKGRVSADEV